MVQPAAALQSVADSDSVVDHLFALHLVLWQGFVVVPQQVHSVPKMEAVEYHAHVISWARRNQVITFLQQSILPSFRQSKLHCITSITISNYSKFLTPKERLYFALVRHAQGSYIQDNAGK